MSRSVFTPPPGIVHRLSWTSPLLLLLACGDGGSPELGSSAGGGSSSASDGRDDDGADSSGDDDTGAEGCEPADVGIEPLFPVAIDVEPVVEVRDDGVIITRGAGRVRGRHELEGTYNPFGERYFENRSYGFVIEDHVAAGEDRIEIAYYPEAPVSTYGSVTNLRVWKIYGDGNVFYNNSSLDTIDLQHQVKTLTGNYREDRPMQVGDSMEFEFGVFIAGNDPADPGAIEGRTSYYTDTFRYRVGEGGLHPYNDDPSGRLGPGPDGVLAGDTTVPYVQTEDELAWVYSQMALDMQPSHVQRFLEGRRLFHTDFETGEHGEAGNPALPEHAGKMGPQFNVASCDRCHEHNGRGAMPPVGEVLRGVAVKLYDQAALGAQLQPQEAELVLEGYDVESVELVDGTTVELRRPRYAGADPAWAYSPRIARQLPGLGLLEAIDESEILARASGCDDAGISGRPSVVVDPEDGALRLGRFGWKAEKASLRHQVADALAQDIGVTTSVFPGDDETAELSDDDLERLVAYVSLLGLPGRRDIDDPQVRRGEEVFAGIGCGGCHVIDAFTAGNHPLVELRDQRIHPYSDLLLHDMGEGLADPQGGPAAAEWRTAPLWGVGLVDDVHGEGRYLHDGRARTRLEAILWHGGEASFAQAAVRAASTEDREALLAFLESL